MPSRGDAVDAVPALGHHLGELGARAVAGAWRSQPPARHLSPAEVERVTPHLLACGLGGLGWHALGGEGPLRDAHRMHAIHARLHERRLHAVLDACDGAGVDPLLIKGWAAARRYPAPALRPFGDVDLVVADADRARAAALFPEGGEHDVDLDHFSLSLGGVPVDELFAASRTVPFGDRAVRVLGDEDDLRVLALHFLGSGGWRLLSLCDVATAVEARGPGFDWDRALTSGRTRRGWVLTALALARDLLGADVRDTPAARVRVPAWLRDHVLAGFASVPADHIPAAAFAGAGVTARLRALRHRWPADPLLASLRHGAPLTRFKPVPVAAWDLAMRAKGAR